MSENVGKSQGEKEIRPEEMKSGKGRGERALSDSTGLAQRLQSEETFPVTLAFLTGAVAALIIITAGLHSERQTDVVMERAMIGFLVSGLVMFLACRWLNDRGIPLYVSRHADMQHSWVSEPETEDAVPAPSPSDEKVSGGEASDLPENTLMSSTSEAGFSPLESSLPHVEVPKG